MRTSIKLVVPIMISVGLTMPSITLAKELVIKFSHVTTEDTPKGKGVIL